MLTEKQKTVFEIIGAYFVNIYDNELYKASLRNSIEKNISITDAYEDCVTYYVAAFCDRESRSGKSHYHKIILDILKYYRLYSGYSTVSLSDFIDTIVQQLTPDTKYRNMNNREKDVLLRESLTNILKRFTSAILTKHLSIIIDNRENDHRNLRAIQNTFIKLMKQQRDNIISLFIEAGAGPNGKKKAEGVSVAVLEKMKKMLREALEDKRKMQIKFNTMFAQLKQQIIIRDQEIAELKASDDKIAEYEEIIEELRNQNGDCEDLNNKIAEYEDIIKDLRNKIAEYEETNNDLDSSIAEYEESEDMEVETKEVKRRQKKPIEFNDDEMFL